MALQASLVILHEPWLDEWQSLQIAVQSPDFSHLLENLRYEGHPPLYYLLLRGVAAIVPLPLVLTATQLPIALAIQHIILFHSFTRRIDRLLFALSAFVLIDYGTIARSLSLGVLVFLFYWAFRRTRWAWIAIVLLPAVDFLFGLLSLICLTLLRSEGRWSWPGATLWLISSLLAAWTVIPAPDAVPALHSEAPLIAPLVLLTYLSQLLFPLPLSEGGLVWNSTFPIPLAVPAGYAFLIFAWWILRPVTLHRALFAAFTAIVLAFSILVYLLPIRHLSLIALLMIALVWRADELGLPRPRVFTVWLVIAAICGCALGLVNLVRPFDTAGQAARWIRKSDLTDRHWVAFGDSRAQGVAMLNAMQFTRLGHECQQDFIRWNNRLDLESRDAIFLELDRLGQKYGRYYLLTDMQVASPNHLLRPIHHIGPGFNGQHYYLYIVRPDLPESNLRPPPCVIEQRILPPWTLREQEMRERARLKLQDLLGKFVPSS